MGKRGGLAHMTSNTSCPRRLGAQPVRNGARPNTTCPDETKLAQVGAPRASRDGESRTQLVLHRRTPVCVLHGRSSSCTGASPPPVRLTGKRQPQRPPQTRAKPQPVQTLRRTSTQLGALQQCSQPPAHDDLLRQAIHAEGTRTIPMAEGNASQGHRRKRPIVVAIDQQRDL